MKNKQIASIFLAAIFSAALLSGCGSPQESTGSGPPAQDAPSAAATPEQQAESSVFPVSFSAYGHSCSISGYKLGETDDGNVAITLYGASIGILFEDGVFSHTVECKYQSAGTEYDFKEMSNSSDDGFMISFDSSAAPEKITLINGETKESIVEFNIADEPQLK